MTSSAFPALPNIEDREEFYRTLVDHASDGILVVSSGGEILEVNQALCNLLGYSATEFLGRHVHEFFEPGDLNAHPIRFDYLAAGGGVVRERQLLKADGSLAQVEISSRGVPGGMIVGIVRDISRRFDAESALKTSERRMAALLRGIPDLMLRMNREGRYLDYHQGGDTPVVEGSSLRVGCLIGDVLPPLIADQRLALIGVALDTGKTQHAEYSMELYGRTVHFETHIAPIDHNEVIVVVRDVSARKLAEEERRKIESQFLQAQKMEAVGRLVGGVAHDFNNLLTPILGRGELALRRVGPDSPIQDELKVIVEAARQAGELTRQLLTFSRKQDLRLQPTDVNEVLAAFARMIKRMIGEDIELEMNLQPDLPIIMGDATQLQQVLMNLAVNARDAMPEGGQLFITSASSNMPSRSGSARRAIQIRVADTGSGMSRDVAERVFEPFFTTKGEDGGTGLGLSTVYGIVSQHDGYVFVESMPGLGTTFSIYLPVTDAPQVTKPRRDLHAQAPVSSGNILIVEDNQLVRDLTHEVLEMQGYQVISVASGHKALDALDAADVDIDLLLTDVIMPQMDGRQLADEVVLRRPNCRVLYMSGYTANVISSRGVSEDGQHFIQKPFTPADLARKVADILSDGASTTD